MKSTIRHLLFSEEFKIYYANLPLRVQRKYDYVLNILRTQYVVSTKFVKKLENSSLYELRVSISTNEYRTILFSVDSETIIECRKAILLNSFLKKDSKQYKNEILYAENLLKKMEEQL